MAKVRRRADGPDAGGLVAYYRVSTAKQGASGLGLEGQQAAVEAHARASGRPIVATFTEVESGKSSARPQLADALAFAQRGGHRLIIAKLDRLSRNVAFTANLMEAGVDFTACDNPHANRLTVHILAAVAEAEARMISDRTKEALKAYKAGRRVSKRLRQLHPEGVPPEVEAATAGKLGASLPQCRTLTTDRRSRGVARSAAVRRERAIEAYADLAPWMAELRAEGKSLREVAAALNSEGHTTRQGNPWTKMQVSRVLGRSPGGPAPRVGGAARPGEDAAA